MKVAVVFVLLFATVLCRPARKVSVSSSDSSEEVVRAEVPAAPAQNIVAATAASSDESTANSDEQATVDPTLSSDTASVDSKDSEDSDDDDDAEESETEEEDDESSHSSESGESSTPAPATVTPVMVTEEPVAETTIEPIQPTIVTDTDSGRGDSMGGYPSDYKSIVYVEDKSYHKVPAPYKSYEFLGTGKKMAYDMTDGNEVEKTLTVYKVQALQVHSDLLEEDASTPEVENQGLDVSQDQDPSPRQSSLPEESTSTSDASTSDGSTSDGSTSDATNSESESSSAPEEEEDESASTASDSTSTSQESEDEESQSSEEATATPGAADSESDESDSTESDSDEERAGPDTTTDMPVVITAK